MQISAALEWLALYKMRGLGARGQWRHIHGVRLHELELPASRDGAGERSTLVLVHGLGSNAGSYGALMSCAHPHFQRVVAPSSPGHGLSPLHGSGYDTEELFTLWRALLDLYSQEGPVYLLGTSLGGAIALRYAIERPSRVKGLILCSPAGAQMSEVEIEHIKRSFRMDRLSDGARFLRLLLHSPPHWSLLLGLVVRATLGGELIQGFLRELNPKLGLSAEQLSSLEVPTLLFWGQSERILPRGLLKRYQACIPSRLLTILEPEAFGHSPQLERPHELMSSLLKWLLTLEPSSSETQA